MMQPGVHFSVIAYGLLLLFIGLFGVACIVRPKFGNLSRAMGVSFLGLAATCWASKLGSWRLFSISLGIFVAAGFFWCGVECFRLRKAKALSRTVGASLVLLGAGSEYFSWLIWSHIPTK